MVPALILAISVVSLVRFAMSYFRAILIQAGQSPVSDEVRAAARLKRADISGEDFGALRGVHSLTPGGAGGVGLVAMYYRAVQAVGLLAGAHEGIGAWTKREMASCACYVGVQIDRRLRLSMAQHAPSL
jgi:hypothetical protein